MDMLLGGQIADANLTDWRKLAQGLHARYLVEGFGAAARFVAAVGEAGDELGHYPRVSIGQGYVDLKLVSDDATYRDSHGTEHVVQWVTQRDVDLARRISDIAADHNVDADPASVSDIELGLDTARSATIAPVWSALLTGSAEAQGEGPPATRSEIPRAGCRTCGSATPTSARPRHSGSTSRSTWPPRRQSSGSPPLSPRVGPSSMRATRHRSPSSPTRMATRASSASTSPP